VIAASVNELSNLDFAPSWQRPGEGSAQSPATRAVQVWGRRIFKYCFFAVRRLSCI